MFPLTPITSSVEYCLAKSQRRFWIGLGVSLALTYFTALPSMLAAGLTFPNPGAAKTALIQAAASADKNQLMNIFGAEAEALINSGDDTFDTFVLGKAAKEMREQCVIARRDDKTVYFNLGSNSWRFPLPLVKVADGWQFDVDQGAKEIAIRRVRRNQATAANVMRECAKAQKLYVQKDHDGDGIKEYAQRFISTEGKEDGLSWKTTGPEDPSPLATLSREARKEGYTGEGADKTVLFRGYNYRILTNQGPAAPGGEKDYLADGHLTGGFAIVAWPATWGNSGDLTFIVNQSGRVFSKDLGTNTAEAAPKINSYNPDATWKPATL